MQVSTKKHAREFSSIEEIDQFILAYREQRNIQYLLWRLDRFGKPLPEIYQQRLGGRKHGKNQRRHNA